MVLQRSEVIEELQEIYATLDGLHNRVEVLLKMIESETLISKFPESNYNKSQ